MATDEPIETPEIRAENLFRSFVVGDSSIEVLKGVTLTIKPGEKVFLCGPSGAGKTTLLYTLAGLEEPESGDVFVGDEAIYSGSRRRRAKIRNRYMGYVFQNYFLLPDLTAAENVLLPAMIQRGSGAKIERARSLLDRVGLGDRADHLPAELSGGEQQRCAIARALMNDPPVIFADEPTGNLDSSTRDAIMETLFTVVEESNKTLLVVTHDQRLADLGDRTIRIVDGHIEGSSGDLAAKELGATATKTVGDDDPADVFKH